MNLPEEAKDLYFENYKMLMKETKNFLYSKSNWKEWKDF